MVIMESSRQKNKLFDPIRHLWVESTPEEQVRQGLIAYMLKQGYPSSLMGVEVGLSQFNAKALFSQRADLIVYSQTNQKVLALIECKAHKVTEKTLDQILSYNRYLQALWIVCVGPNSLISVIQKPEGLCFQNTFFSYPQLCALEQSMVNG